MSPPTVLSSLQGAAQRLREAGVVSDRLDAALLLTHVLGVERHRLGLMPERELSAAEAERFEALVTQRAQRRPISHILGRSEFWSLEMRVSDATLAPRPETEMLVEQAVEFLRDVTRPVVAEVGTGTGCIAVALAHELSTATVHTVDVSPAALAVARENAERHGVAERIVFHDGDTLEPVRERLAPGSLDLVVSNPPYVRHDERDDVDPEVLWEPGGAVFCDGDPADVYARIAREAGPLVRTGGLLLLELPGDDPAPIIAAVEATAAWTSIGVDDDLAGRPRVLRALRNPKQAE